MTAESKKILTTLKKARAHLEKIISMVENDEYCIDIIQQLNAIEGYIDSARRAQLKDHLNTCFVEGVRTGSKKKREEYVDEVIKILKIST